MAKVSVCPAFRGRLEFVIYMVEKILQLHICKSFENLPQNFFFQLNIINHKHNPS